MSPVKLHQPLTNPYLTQVSLQIQYSYSLITHWPIQLIYNFVQPIISLEVLHRIPRKVLTSFKL